MKNILDFWKPVIDAMDDQNIPQKDLLVLCQLLQNLRNLNKPMGGLLCALTTRIFSGIYQDYNIRVINNSTSRTYFKGFKDLYDFQSLESDYYTESVYISDIYPKCINFIKNEFKNKDLDVYLLSNCDDNLYPIWTEIK